MVGCVGVRQDRPSGGARAIIHGVRFLNTRPLKVSECAAYMGVSPEYIRQAIVEGIPVGDLVVRLDAETLTSTHRNSYRIHESAFFDFLQAIGWKHLPGHAARLPAQVTP